MAWLYFVALAPDASQPSVSANLGVVAAYGAGKVIQFAFPLMFVLVFSVYASALSWVAPSFCFIICAFTRNW